MMPRVSVVSLAYNRRENVRELLTALRGQDYASFEVILVDNASPDATAAMVRRDFPEVKLIETGSNLGMVAYNLGFEAAQGDYILVMDDDGLPACADWIAQVVARFEANPRLGAVCCTIRMRDTGRIAHDSPQYVPQRAEYAGYPAVAFNGTGAGLRASALRQVGCPPYPWHFFRTYLELHLCTRLLDAGWEVKHFPALEVWHTREAQTAIQRPATYYGMRNYYWYVWELYPWPAVVIETFHELGRGAKLALEHKAPWSRLWQSMRNAFLCARPAFSHRHPVSPETLQYLRWVRRHANWYGIAPQVVRFAGKPIRNES